MMSLHKQRQTPNGPSEAFYKSLESWRDEQGDEATLYKLILLKH